MRKIIALVFGCQLWLAPALAQTSPEPALIERLPLFAANHCEQHKNTANLLFCGDPVLAEAGARLAAAVQARLGRVADRPMAIEENAQWLRHRNRSCGIFDSEPPRAQDLDRVKACLLRESEERVAILGDTNFDCLASDSAAGAVICSEPSLALALAELNDQVVSLMNKLKDEDANAASAEYARWVRERDRKCRLDGKDNVPLAELSGSETCLAELISRKHGEISAAKGDPKRVFGRQLASPLPNADGVDFCVARIHTAGNCGNFVRVSRIFEIDNEADGQNAISTAEIEMIVLSPFDACSPVAVSCTGACWDGKSGKPATAANEKVSFRVTHRVTIERSFAFSRQSDGWQCLARELQPIDFGAALAGR